MATLRCASSGVIYFRFYKIYNLKIINIVWDLCTLFMTLVNRKKHKIYDYSKCGCYITSCSLHAKKLPKQLLNLRPIYEFWQ